jgi:septum formation protein
MNSESLSTSLILASSSKYRKLLLRRFGIPFDCVSPQVDETPHESESAIDLVARLAKDKAKAVSRTNPHAIVIGSDQIAVFENQIIGKPGNFEAATKQLSSFSGRDVDFLTAVSVQCKSNGFIRHHIDTTRVCFRQLEPDEIKRYLEIEKPFDCAGAFKAESLGIVLFKRISCDDPTALIGLPLIQTAALLRQAGLALP